MDQKKIPLPEVAQLLFDHYCQAVDGDAPNGPQEAKRLRKELRSLGYEVGHTLTGSGMPRGEKEIRAAHAIVLREYLAIQPEDHLDEAKEDQINQATSCLMVLSWVLDGPGLDVDSKLMADLFAERLAKWSRGEVN